MALELTIDVELENYLPGVPAQCDSDLEASVVKSNGPIDQIRYFVLNGENIVVDGHRRLKICRRLGLPYKTEKMNFRTKEEAKAWMDEYQASRRNLNACDLAIVTARMVRREGEKGRGAIKRVAEKFGVSERTVMRRRDAGEALESLPEEVRKRIAAGGLEITQQEVIALSELPEFHIRRVLAEFDSGAWGSLWEAIRGEAAPKPKKDAPVDPGALERAPEPSGDEMIDSVSVKAEEKDMPAFFKRALYDAGRLTALVADHKHMAPGMANKCLSLLDRLNNHLTDWKDNE